ncbi:MULTISPECIES: NAD-dependent epimerase/dehydratase family protein [Mycobacteriaceae]|uniref:Dehydrogenase n=1 Tax=Mycolicibacterium neoaurum VKM Ac-1815D TaxID=700508 RepID=V5XIY2_MYCNE|nr:MULTISPECIES: NAD-dependent epimerase/dehydratase family protein [Mycobacteriaceae]AHC27444.1 dehydrogenase [Mycolicibacterium neoaurum VKM Ac-1815D]AMO07654.1 dehydrogenase [Mycolicibacterium neoaurum]AXK73957.1 NAD-dependent epimerase/dehydratase family protein [Mycolicibacterium neoaurum]KJQ51608.1 dehydrogenase [Mycolicibacterium neoaurum]KUM08815.1 dehydrogenase [Mycolicibacterium neoaurum]
MRIAITGGTGYLGAHITRALLAAGHQVRLLVAPGAAADPVIAHLAGEGEVAPVEGDVRDTATVERLLRGCDAVLHAAGVVGTDRRRARLMWEINAHATETVLLRAVDAGLDPVVCVSSYSALFPPPDGVITENTPPAAGRSPYAQTKAYADRVARHLQERGAPVVVSYPSSVVGPAWHTAPGVTERGWAPIVAHGLAPRMPGGMQMIDVTDIADVHVRSMVPGRGPQRYVCGGEMVAFDDMIDLLEQGSGRRIRRIALSPGLFRGIGRVADLAGRMLPVGDGISYEAALLLTSATPTDDRHTRTALGIDAWRSPRSAILACLQR